MTTDSSTIRGLLSVPPTSLLPVKSRRNDVDAVRTSVAARTRTVRVGRSAGGGHRDATFGDIAERRRTSEPTTGVSTDV
jgi:hypothetical protein